MGQVMTSVMANSRVVAALGSSDEAELRAALLSNEFLPSELATYMVMAMMLTKPDALRVLLDHGANPNADVEELSVLTFACYLGSVAMVQILLDAGADINRKSKFGVCPLLMAVLQNHTDVCELLIHCGATVKDVMLEKVPAENLVETAYFSIPSLKPSTPANFTPLMSAASDGNLAIVSMLIKAGVDGDARDAKGETALMSAAEGDHVEAIQVLLDAGAHVDTENHTKRTTMMVAASRGKLATVQCLLDRGAHLNYQDNTGCTALLLASTNGHVDVVRLLTERGAELERQDMDDDTALMKAAKHGHQAIVSLLVDAGAVERKSKPKNWLLQSSVANLARRSRWMWSTAHGKKPKADSF